MAQCATSRIEVVAAEIDINAPLGCVKGAADDLGVNGRPFLVDGPFKVWRVPLRKKLDVFAALQGGLDVGFYRRIELARGALVLSLKGLVLPNRLFPRASMKALDVTSQRRARGDSEVKRCKGAWASEPHSAVDDGDHQPVKRSARQHEAQAGGKIMSTGNNRSKGSRQGNIGRRTGSCRLRGASQLEYMRRYLIRERCKVGKRDGLRLWRDGFEGSSSSLCDFGLASPMRAVTPLCGACAAL